MRYYVTLFDSNYLTRGLVLYRSLLRHSSDFHLWIICFDDLAYELLNKLNLEKVSLVSLKQFEDEELLRVKSERTRGEYCWTCTPSAPLYVLNTASYVDAITYLDADLMFFASPESIFTEARDASIILTEHRYLPGLNQAKARGTYNVQFMMFRRDSEGLRALNWWRERCLEWCFARVEDNKFGDQKYLDDWTERFAGVHVLKNLGAGLAPWNAAQYSLHKLQDKVHIEAFPLIFYHFHSLRLHYFKVAYLCYDLYPINQELRDWIYRPYLKELSNTYRDVRVIAPKFNAGISDFPLLPRRPIKLYEFLKFTASQIQQGRYCLYA